MGLLNFATYFDENYLLRGLALYRSLARHSPPFKLWVLGLDDETCETLERLALPGVELVPLPELERFDAELRPVRSTRQSYEYFWTCGPAYLLYLFEQRPEIELLTYLDSDLFFFDDPTPVYEILGAGTLLIVGHRYADTVPPFSREKGTYNVGLNLFRRCPQALACLRRWRAQCLEWCYHRVEGNRYGDQKYLDEWPTRYKDVVVLDHKGGGLAPWNLGSYQFRYEQGRVWVDDDPLLFYHFVRLRALSRWVSDPSVYYFRQRLDRVVKRHVYVPYVRELRAARRLVEGIGRRVASPDRLKSDDSKLRQLARMLRHRSFLIVTDRFAL